MRRIEVWQDADGWVASLCDEDGEVGCLGPWGEDKSREAAEKLAEEAALAWGIPGRVIGADGQALKTLAH